MRVDYRTVHPEIYRAMHDLQERVDAAGIEPALAEMLRLRASQINGCAFCVQLHSRAARAAGVDEDKIHLVSVWREALCFTRRERAALAWCEAVTHLPETGAPDADYAALAEAFSPEEVVVLTWIVGVINAWNRVAVPMRRGGGRPAEEM